MNEETTFIGRSNWIKPAPDLQYHYHLLFHANRHLGHTAVKAVSNIKDVLNHEVTMPKTGKLFSPMISKKANELYERLSKLKTVVKRSHEVLATARTVMLPFNMFPDTVVVDRSKITITKRTFFWSSSVISIRIEDVLNVGMSTGPLFGSITVSSRVMNSTDHFQVNYFWRDDAIKLKHIIQGYMIALHNSIDTKDLSRDQLIETLLEIGRDSD